jgi:tetratricopeptide (TPR) repeat protein
VVLHVLACETVREPSMRALGRQLPALAHGRLRSADRLSAYLEIDGTERPHAGDAVLSGELRITPERPGATDVPVLEWTVRLAEHGATAPLLEQRYLFPVDAVFESVERVTDDVSEALELAPPTRNVPRCATQSFPALRDWLRAVDLDDGADDLETDDRLRALEWLLLAVEADPAFEPARDALLVSGLRAHGQGMRREARRALRLGAQLAPLDARLPYVLGELLTMDERRDEAVRAYRRCVSVDPDHPQALGRLEALGAAPDGRSGALHAEP